MIIKIIVTFPNILKKVFAKFKSDSTTEGSTFNVSLSWGTLCQRFYQLKLHYIQCLDGHHYSSMLARFNFAAVHKGKTIFHINFFSLILFFCWPLPFILCRRGSIPNVDIFFVLPFLFLAVSIIFCATV